jgi:hypothetical protein
MSVWLCAGMKRAFATRLAGSADLYQNHNRRPFHSINFVTAHDGFSLYDLVRGGAVCWGCVGHHVVSVLRQAAGRVAGVRALRRPPSLALRCSPCSAHYLPSPTTTPPHLHHRLQVSYNAKRNDANGEGNRDGTNDNFSWNCGAEGETGDPGVAALRQRQMRNFLVALMMSQGTPMIVAGEGFKGACRRSRLSASMAHS